MSLKIFRSKKSMLALAIAFLIVMPMLISVATAQTTPTGTIKAVKNGTTTTQNWDLGANPIGTTFKVDVRIDGATPLTIWGWAADVSWNPAVLQLTKVSNGAFLTSDTGDMVAFVGSNSAQWDLNAGKINGGIACADQDYPDPQTSNTAGVLATLTFKVVGYGTSPITIENGNLRSFSADTIGTSVPTYSATVTAKNAPAAGIISAVQSGTSTSTITVPAGQSTVAVDVRIDGASQVWGWGVNVNWNPAVLQLTKVTQGDYLSSTGDNIAFVGSNSAQWDQVVGTINGGIAAADQDYSSPQTTNTAGILATLTFKVVGSGTSQITLSNGNLRSYSSDLPGTTATVNSATVNVEAPPQPKETQITVQYTPDQVNKYNAESVTISGVLTSEGSAIANAQVTLSTTTGQIATVTTGADGSYSYAWTPETTVPNGYYPITATYAGDASYAASTATTAAPGLFVLPEYAWGALIALVTAFAAFAAFAVVKKSVHVPTFSKRI